MSGSPTRVHVSPGHLELAAAYEVAAGSAASGAREGVELVDRLLARTPGAPDRGLYDVKLEPRTVQQRPRRGDGPGAEQGVRQRAAEGTDPQPYSLDAYGVRPGSRPLHGHDHRRQQSQFVHGTIVAPLVRPEAS